MHIIGYCNVYTFKVTHETIRDETITKSTYTL